MAKPKSNKNEIQQRRIVWMLDKMYSSISCFIQLGIINPTFSTKLLPYVSYAYYFSSY